jgi:hypothetical protein
VTASVDGAPALKEAHRLEKYRSHATDVQIGYVYLNIVPGLCRAADHGVRLASSVSKATKFLISAQENPEGALTRKYQHAKELGIPIIEAWEDLEVLRNAILKGKNDGGN